MAEITEQISSSADDGYCAGTNFYPSRTYAIFGDSGSGVSNNAFFRFSGVNIPNGAEIISAELQFKSAGDYSTTVCNVNIFFENADDPSAPVSVSDYNGRSLTDAVAWNGVGSWSADGWYPSPDVSEILQAVVNREGWSPGNDIIAYVKNNSSSSGAYRVPRTIDIGSTEAAKLVIQYLNVEYAETYQDSTGVGDATEGISLTDGIGGAVNLNDNVDGSTLNEILQESIGISDEIEPFFEYDGKEVEAAGLSVVAIYSSEINAIIENISGFGDHLDAFNWSEWLTNNLDRAVARYYCTITGSADGETDIEVPISSFQARKQTGSSTYLSVVIPGIDYLDAISARANGEMVIEMAYLIGGVESIREEILRADIEQINYYRGTGSRSVTLIGHFAQTFVAKETRLYNPVYAQRADGDLSYRFAVPDLYVNPGDTVRVGDDAFTADAVLYMVSAGGGQTVMEVQE